MMSRQQKYTTTTGRDLPTAVLPSLLLGLNWLLFGTWAVYSLNPHEFLVSYGALLWKFFAPAILVFIGLGLASIKLGLRSRLIFNTIILFLVFASYIHGNLLSWNSGILDGTSLSFSETWRSGLDGLVWLMLAYLVIRFRRWLYVHGWQICLLLIVFQGIAALSSLLNFEAAQRTTTSFPDKLGRFSPELNVIHIVLDGFQGNVFEDLLKAHPDLEENLSGFTLFRDATTASDVTYLSIPAALSGQIFTNQTSISEYHQNTLEGDNLYRFLNDNKFDVDIATPFLWNKPQPWFNSYMRIPTPYAGKGEIETSSAFLLLDISLFRQVPHFFKPGVYGSGRWLLSGTLVSNPEQQFQSFSHLSFLEDLQTRLSASARHPKYKFLHLVTPHAPLVHQQDCGFSGVPRENKATAYPDQAYCALKAVISFLTELQSQGIYDRSLILIHADHGAGIPFNMRRGNGDATNSFDALRHVWGNPLPLVLIKPVAGKGRLKVSNQQVQLTDLPRTTAELLGLNTEFPGHSMFSEDVITNEDSADITRYFYHSSTHRTEASQKDRFDDFVGYQINGSIFEVDSWQQILRYTAPVTNELQIYNWNTKITFGAAGSFLEFETGGWARETRGGTSWAVGKAASLAMDFGAVQNTVNLRAKVRPYLVPGELDQQNVNIYVGETKAGEWSLNNQKFQEISLQLPASVFNSDGKTEITFEFLDAASPVAMGTGKDTRELAVAFMALQFDLLDVD